MKEPEIRYYQAEIEDVFQKLVSGWSELTEFYNDEVRAYYKDQEERIPYLDIGDISRFIVEKKKLGQTDVFEVFFENAEEILIYGDHYVQELIVIGLFEGIQNNGDAEIDYHRSFDQWLRPNSKEAWRALITFWETKGEG